MISALISLVILILDIIAIVEVVRSGKSTGEKLVWILVILLLPVLGMILWYLIGRK
jgi:hypothetical protein